MIFFLLPLVKVWVSQDLVYTPFLLTLVATLSDASTSVSTRFLSELQTCVSGDPPCISVAPLLFVPGTVLCALLALF